MTWGGMTGKDSAPSGGRDGAPDDGSGGGPRGGENAGWTIFSYLIAGMAVYGGIGWLIALWTGYRVIFPLGMLVGLILSVVLIFYRYGRS